MDSTTVKRSKGDKPPFWRDIRTLSWGFQIAVLAGAVALIAVLFNNVRVNSANLGLPLSFDFLDQPTSFTIPGNDLRESQPVRDAIFEGAMNTVRVAVVGLVLATILGIAVGIARLSGNWMVRTMARFYVELLRNVPLLGIVIFAYLAIVLNFLPKASEAWEIGSVFVISNRGIVVPWFIGSGIALLAAALIGAVAGYLVARWRSHVAASTGKAANDLPWAIGVFLAAVAVGVLLIGLGYSGPTRDGNRVVGGMSMQPEYFALLVALVIYTASHIAEIVRGSIQAVPKGQFEAGSSLALSGTQRMRYVVLPQALRIAVPAIGNQYLNLVKNSSLGFAISYFELTKVSTTTIGNRSPAVPVFMLLMAIYLLFSLTLSVLINTVNRRMQVHLK